MNTTSTNDNQINQEDNMEFVNTVIPLNQMEEGLRSFIKAFYQITIVLIIMEIFFLLGTIDKLVIINTGDSNFFSIFFGVLLISVLFLLISEYALISWGSVKYLRSGNQGYFHFVLIKKILKFTIILFASFIILFLEKGDNSSAVSMVLIILLNPLINKVTDIIDLISNNKLHSLNPLYKKPF